MRIAREDREGNVTMEFVRSQKEGNVQKTLDELRLIETGESAERSRNEGRRRAAIRMHCHLVFL